MAKLNFFKKIFLNKNAAILVPSIFIAGLFWFLTVLSKTYIGTLIYPIIYVNVPKDKVVVSPLPKRAVLSVKASGWEIITNRLQNKNYPVLVNIDALKNKNFLVTNSNLEMFTEHLSADIDVYHIQPDTIYFEFDNSINKKIPVKLNHEITFKKQYGLGENFLLKPDSVTITGPQSIVLQKKFWNTEKVILENVDRTMNKKINLAEPDNSSISLSEKSVELNIPVVEYTEGNKEIPIDIITPNKGYKFVIYPKTIKITYSVSLKKYKMVKPELFEAVVDFSKIDIFANHYAEIKVTQKPTFVSNVNFSPKMVEFVIYK